MTAPRLYKLREDLVVRKRTFGGDVKYVVKDPDRLEYYTIDELAYHLLSLCDGRKDLATISEEAQMRFPGLGLNTLTLLNLYESYRSFHFFEDAWEKNILLIERRRTNRMRALQQAFANPLFITLPAWNPNAFFDRIIDHIRFLFGRAALVVYAIIILAAIVISTTHADEFALGMGELWVIQGKAFLGIVVLWCVLLLTVVLHELGHGLTCKHFGGGVYKLGFLFMYFNPCMYCDVTEAYFFEDKNKKHWVTIAGGIVDLVTASLATFVWFLTPQDLFIHEVAHRVALFNGVSGILVNFNPLMKYDGYYLLSDELEIPNLRGDSFRFLGNRMRSLFGLPVEEELHTRRERRIFWIYGVLGVLYAIFVLWFVLLFFGGFMVAKLGATGYLITGAVLFLMTRRYLWGLGRFMRFIALDKQGHFKRYAWAYGLGVIGLLAILVALPIPRHVRSDFRFVPGSEFVLRAQEPGLIESVRVREGDTLGNGARPITLESGSLQVERAQAASGLTAARAGRAHAQVSGDASRAATETAALTAQTALLEHQDQRTRRLEPVVPVTGVVLTPFVHELTGMACAPGDTLLTVGTLDPLRAEILLDEQDLGLLDTERRVELRTRARPGEVLEGRVISVADLPIDGTLRMRYRVLVEVDNPGGTWRPGMTGVARFDAGRAPPVQHFFNQMAKLFRIEFWI